MSKRPLILSPAGSPDALYAALDAGADEVYFGLSAHNARQNAKNFTPEETALALKACKFRGVKSNITLNTLVSDREIKDACKLAYDALLMGADAFIVQDLGLARALKKSIPGIVLHASTQCACHSAAGAEQLMELGFSRIVLARELDENEIKSIVGLGCETEVFVHGALCVCHSGMCLMSSVIGKRSGNRGLCAQPCRLPYNFGKEKARDRYPLSLKDLSLAKHIPELTELGITSLKIEGRMKPPEYVSGVTGIWKTLVTDNRNADEAEYEYLEKLFSRSGFTDGYFTGAYRNKNRNMYGIRTESDKADTKELEAINRIGVKRSVSMVFTVEENKKPELKVICESFTHTETADFEAQTATGRPMTEEDISASLSKLGDTVFECNDIKVDIIGNVFIAKSQLNGLRRAAIAGLEQKILSEIPSPVFDDSIFETTKAEKEPVIPELRLFADSIRTAERMVEKYKDNGFSIESICVPLGAFSENSAEKDLAELKNAGIKIGVKMPRVVFTSETDGAQKLLDTAKNAGASYAVAENIGHLPLINKSGLELCTGLGMNVYNSYCADVLKELGAKSVMLSPELIPAQIRDIKKDGYISAVAAKGRLELMVLESCVKRAKGDCGNVCDGRICFELCDRTGTVFPVRCEQRLSKSPYPGRNIVLNSVPIRLLNKPEELKKTGVRIYCIFGTEQDI